MGIDVELQGCCVLTQKTVKAYNEPKVGRLNSIQSTSSFVKSLGGMEMLDFVFIVLVLVFFGLSFWYVRACDRL